MKKKVKKCRILKIYVFFMMLTIKNFIKVPSLKSKKFKTRRQEKDRSGGIVDNNVASHMQHKVQRKFI